MKEMYNNTPKWIKLCWIIVIPGLLFFLGRMTYECIYLTLKNGEQMIGFSFIHLHPTLYIWMVLSYFASIIWCVIYAIWLIKIAIEKKKTDGLGIFISTVIIVIFISLLEPISKFLY